MFSSPGVHESRGPRVPESTMDYKLRVNMQILSDRVVKFELGG
jgi:hypothetical protein